MTKKLATGPFQVPIFATGGIQADQFNNVLNIVLKNHSHEKRKVIVKVEKCRTVLFPLTSTESDLLPDTKVELEKGECTVLQVSISPGDILRVEVKGEIDEELEKME
jgi:hypothetical protein